MIFPQLTIHTYAIPHNYLLINECLFSGEKPLLVRRILLKTLIKTATKVTRLPDASCIIITQQVFFSCTLKPVRFHFFFLWCFSDREGLGTL